MVTPPEAVKAVRSWVDAAPANFCVERRLPSMALTNRAHELVGARIFHSAPFGLFQEKWKPESASLWPASTTTVPQSKQATRPYARGWHVFSKGKKDPGIDTETVPESLLPDIGVPT